MNKKEYCKKCNHHFVCPFLKFYKFCPCPTCIAIVICDDICEPWQQFHNDVYDDKFGKFKKKED